MRDNTDWSSQASTALQRTGRSVAETNVNVGAMLESMREIGASSGQISKIIKVIDEIAFQTNILGVECGG